MGEKERAAHRLCGPHTTLQRKRAKGRKTIVQWMLYTRWTHEDCTVLKEDSPTCATQRSASLGELKCATVSDEPDILLDGFLSVQITHFPLFNRLLYCDTEHVVNLLEIHIDICIDVTGSEV